MKATEGCGFVDGSCDTKFQINKAAGKLLGVYHFARPDLNFAEDEANFFVNNVRGYIGEAILVLDWEQPGTQGNVVWAKAWLDKVYELTGVKPLIYMSASVIREYDWSSVASEDYGLWVAGYPDLRDSFDLPDFIYDVSPWSFYALWQFTNSGGRLDRDVFMGDREAWLKYAGTKIDDEASQGTNEINEGKSEVDAFEPSETDLRAFEIAIDEQALELFVFANMAPKKKKSIKIRVT
jgi:GH25 family lysozyme M1 (1,4-beta-N-acetylmuramidase)